MSLKQKFKYIVPIPVKKGLKVTYYSLIDIKNKLTGKYDPTYPPLRLNFVGSDQFKQIGNEFHGYFKNILNIKPNDAVLDIGCGIGRMAIPLTQLIPNGKYEGFDINKKGIDWCKKNITPKHQHFKFTHSNIYNKYYNKKGTVKADKYKFPYPDNTFDHAIATSVFTHMLPEQIENYLTEIHRVLKPGGKLFATWFAIDKEALNNKEENTFKFKYQYSPNCFYSHKNNIEAEVGYKIDWIKKQLKNNNLDSDLNIHFGSWAKRKNKLSYQDILISIKK